MTSWINVFNFVYFFQRFVDKLGSTLELNNNKITENANNKRRQKYIFIFIYN